VTVTGYYDTAIIVGLRVALVSFSKAVKLHVLSMSIVLGL